MSLKQLIKQKLMLKEVIGQTFEMPGEPMIYSGKHPVGHRIRGVQYFRNMQWKSLLRSNFRSFYNTNVPVVLIVRFFVTPPSGVKISEKDFSQESMPAVKSYEVCDYILSFQEMLHHVLFNSYRQVVKLDSEKFYSNNPRTEMKFMKWEEYVQLQSDHTNNTKTESLSTHEIGEAVQPQREGNASGDKLRKNSPKRQSITSSEGTASCDNALCDASAVKPTAKSKRRARQPTAHEET